MIRAKKRADFEKHREIKDLNVIDLLVFKSRQDYQETMNCWKQEVREAFNGDTGSWLTCCLQPHIMNWFKKYDDPRESSRQRKGLDLRALN